MPVPTRSRESISSSSSTPSTRPLAAPPAPSRCRQATRCTGGFQQCTSRTMSSSAFFSLASSSQVPCSRASFSTASCTAFIRSSFTLSASLQLSSDVIVPPPPSFEISHEDLAQALELLRAAADDLVEDVGGLLLRRLRLDDEGCAHDDGDELAVGAILMTVVRSAACRRLVPSVKSWRQLPDCATRSAASVSVTVLSSRRMRRQKNYG
eukprot:3642922-Pleurochrysis_carterae.AAC.1